VASVDRGYREVPSPNLTGSDKHPCRPHVSVVSSQPQGENPHKCTNPTIHRGGPYLGYRRNALSWNSIAGYGLYLRNLRQSLARGRRGAYPSIDAQPQTVSAPDLAPHRRLATASRQGVYLTTGCREGVLGCGTSTGRDTQAITEWITYEELGSGRGAPPLGRISRVSLNSAQHSFHTGQRASERAMQHVPSELPFPVFCHSRTVNRALRFSCCRSSVGQR
jgi:hypothetical protein